MANDYIWELQVIGPRVGVTKETKTSIFVDDPRKPYKCWWNGCGISLGLRTKDEAIEFCTEYLRNYVIGERKKALELVKKADKFLGTKS